MRSFCSKFSSGAAASSSKLTSLAPWDSVGWWSMLSEEMSSYDTIIWKVAGDRDVPR